MPHGFPQPTRPHRVPSDTPAITQKQPESRVERVAPLPGIASAWLAGVCVTALDELRQRGVRAGQHNRSRRRRESRRDRARSVGVVELYMRPDVDVCPIG